MLDFLTLKAWAIEEGFGDVGMCAAEDFAAQHQKVLAQPPLKERQQLRFYPREDNPQATSIAVLLWSYVQAEITKGTSLFIDSYYAASNAAYHAARRLESRLLQSGVWAKSNVSYPARTAAMRAGMGIIGDHGLLIHPQYGTRMVIILMATDLPYASANTDVIPDGTCRKCGRCASVCPSGALDEHGMSHPERCLRNYMMEGILVPQAIRNKMGNRLIGCDLCQRVCPMNEKNTIKQDATLLDSFVTQDQQQFSAQIARLAEMIGRNAARPQRVRAQIALLCGNVGNETHLPVLHAWAQSDFEVVREHARWAIEQIENRRRELKESSAAGLDQSSQTGYNI